MIYIEVEGLKEGLEAQISNLLDKAGYWIEGKAQTIAPRDTGRLGGEIRYKRTGPETGEVVSPVEYSGFLEYGTADQTLVGKYLAGTGKARYHGGIDIGTAENPRILHNGKMLPFMRTSVYAFIAMAESMSADEWKAFLE